MIKFDQSRSTMEKNQNEQNRTKCSGYSQSKGELSFVLDPGSISPNRLQNEYKTKNQRQIISVNNCLSTKCQPPSLLSATPTHSNSESPTETTWYFLAPYPLDPAREHRQYTAIMVTALTATSTKIAISLPVIVSDHRASTSSSGGVSSFGAANTAELVVGS